MVEMRYLGPEAGGIVLGIDPGMGGALAFFGAGQPGAPDYFSVFDMPVYGDGKQRGVDAYQLAYLIQSFKPTKAIVEKVNAMKGWGVGSCFRFGESFGVIRGVLGALTIPIHLVTPQKWKKHYGLPGGDKEASRRLVIERWPANAASFARVKDEGKAEAALIAAYGRKVLS